MPPWVRSYSASRAALRATAQLDLWLERIRQQMGEFQLVGSSAKAEIDLADADFTKPTLLVIGNESSGMSRHYQERCSPLVTIPMGGSVTSMKMWRAQRRFCSTRWIGSEGDARASAVSIL